MKLSRVIILLCIAALIVGLYSYSSAVSTIEQHKLTVPQLTLEMLPVVREDSSESIVAEVTAQSYVVYDRHSQTVLLGKDEHVRRSPASTIKILTALASRATYKSEQIFVVPEFFSVDGSQLAFEPGQVFSLHALLRALLITSANDAAEILALHHPEGRSAFIAELNAIARDFGIETSIETPSGLDSADQKLSAYDLVRLSDVLLDDPELAKIVATPKTVITDYEGRVEYELINTNQLVSLKEISGVKTGTTEAAGQVLIARYQPEDKDMLIVVMGSEDRYEDTLSLIQWEHQYVDWLTMSSSK